MITMTAAHALASVNSVGDDGWDSSLERLWELEQRAELQPEVPLTNGHDQQQAVTDDETANAARTGAAASQRRLHNRKLAQKRYRQRQKVSAQAKQASNRLRLSAAH